MGWDVKLVKCRKGIRWIGTCLYFTQKSSYFQISAEIRDNDGYWIDKKLYRKKDLIFSEYSDMVIGYWKRKLR